jgi:hypothetical protein
MTIDDERDVRARLGAALEDFTPAPLPFDAVVRRGQRVRTRRLVTVVTAVVVVAAVGVAAPELASRGGHQAPVSSRPLHVSVYPPGPGSPAGLIARGRIAGRHWQVSGTRSGHAELCFRAFEMACDPGGPARVTSKGDPADFVMRIGSRPQVEIGTVRQDVSYLTVGLVGGQTLTLRPVPVFGADHARYIAFAIPRAAAVSVITAYSAHGELAYADPFTALGAVQTVRWIRPGAPAPDLASTFVIGEGDPSIQGPSWTEKAYAGPWGSCIGGTGAGSICAPVGLAALRGGHVARLVLESYATSGGVSQGYVAVIAVAPSVSYLIVSRVHGADVRVTPVRAGGGRFCVITSSHALPATGWAAYSASGAKLAGRSLP